MAQRHNVTQPEEHGWMQWHQGRFVGVDYQSDCYDDALDRVSVQHGGGRYDDCEVTRVEVDQ